MKFISETIASLRCRGVEIPDVSDPVLELSLDDLIKVIKEVDLSEVTTEEVAAFLEEVIFLRGFDTGFARLTTKKLIDKFLELKKSRGKSERKADDYMRILGSKDPLTEIHFFLIKEEISLRRKTLVRKSADRLRKGDIVFKKKAFIDFTDRYHKERSAKRFIVAFAEHEVKLFILDAFRHSSILEYAIELTKDEFASKSFKDGKGHDAIIGGGYAHEEDGKIIFSGTSQGTGSVPREILEGCIKAAGIKAVIGDLPDCGKSEKSPKVLAWLKEHGF